MPLADFSLDFSKIESGIGKGVALRDALDARRKRKEDEKLRNQALTDHQSRLAGAKNTEERIQAYESAFTSPDLNDTDRQRFGAVLQTLYSSSGRAPAVDVAAGLARLDALGGSGKPDPTPDPESTVTENGLTTADRLRLQQSNVPDAAVVTPTVPFESALPGIINRGVSQPVVEPNVLKPVTNQISDFTSYIGGLLGVKAPPPTFDPQPRLDIPATPEPEVTPVEATPVNVTPVTFNVDAFSKALPTVTGSEPLVISTVNKAAASPFARTFSDYPQIKAAQIAQESAFNSNAVAKGEKPARSIAQFFPDAATDVSRATGIIPEGEAGVDALVADPELAIDASIAYDEVIATYLRRAGLPVTLDNILASYADGINNVRKARGIPTGINPITDEPFQSTEYIARIRQLASQAG